MLTEPNLNCYGALVSSLETDLHREHAGFLCNRMMGEIVHHYLRYLNKSMTDK